MMPFNPPAPRGIFRRFAEDGEEIEFGVSASDDVWFSAESRLSLSENFLKEHDTRGFEIALRAKGAVE